MRILVIGSYPPPAGAESQQTVETVHRLGAEGNEVHVLSTPGSAAEVLGPVAGPVGALEALRVGRRYDAVVVQVESASPLRMVHRRGARIDRAVDCFMWGLVLRRLRHTTLVVPDPDAVHRSLGGRTGRFLWNAADLVIVTSEYGRRRLVEEGGASATRVAILAVAPRSGRPDRDDWNGVRGAPAIMTQIRRRAADDRRAARRGGIVDGG